MKECWPNETERKRIENPRLLRALATAGYNRIKYAGISAASALDPNPNADIAQRRPDYELDAWRSRFSEPMSYEHDDRY